MDPRDDKRRNRFLSRFDDKYKSDVSNCFLRVLRATPGLTDSEVCRQVWINLRERSESRLELGTGTTPFATFAAVARDNPQLALDYCQWAREWETIPAHQKARLRRGGAHA